MILAAGLGTRLKPFTELIPKPLVPVHGVSAIRMALEQLKPFLKRPEWKTVVNIHAHSTMMRSYLSQPEWAPWNIQISNEESLLLGSAGGFRKALPYFSNNPFFGLNADIVQQVNLIELEKHHFKMKQEFGVVMTLVMHVDPSSLGASAQYRELQFDPKRLLITNVGELKKNAPFYTGVGVFEPKAFEHLPLGVPKEFASDVLLEWVKEKKVGVFPYRSKWLDLGSPELWWKAHQKVNTNELQGLTKDWDLAHFESNWIQYLAKPELDWSKKISERSKNMSEMSKPSLGNSRIQMEDKLYEFPSV